MGKALSFNAPESGAEKDLMMALTGFADTILGAYEEAAPHRICAYIYALANAFNSFYHDVRILAETDEEKKKGYIDLLVLTLKELETSINLLGFEAPDRM